MVANKQNLRVPTSEEARINGKKGGIASGKARRVNKSLKNLANKILESNSVISEEDVQKVLKFYPELDRKEITQGFLFLSEIVSIITQKDKETKEPIHTAGERMKAFEIIRDTSGQKPVEQQIVAFDENNELIIDLGDDEEEEEEDYDNGDEDPEHD